MRSNRSIRIGMALLLGAFVLLVIYLLWQYTRPSDQPTVADGEGVTPVAMRTEGRVAYSLVDLPERSIITADSFRMEELPEGVSTAGYITDPQAQAIGFITRTRISRNDRIRTTDLVGHISDVGIAGALMPGARAMVIPIPAKPTLHDLVRVGDYIDVIAAFDQQESRTIVENVRVLAVDVFGKDYPQTSVAMRGSYKAPPRAIRSDTPASPTAQPTAQPAPGAEPGEPAPAATPTPTPTPTPEAQAAPAPALTLEVTPQQANSISLAQNSGATIDFIIVPRQVFIAPGDAVPGQVQVAAVTRPQLAPYAESKKQQATAQARTARSNGSSAPSRPPTRTVRNDYPSGPPMPAPVSDSGGGLPPAGVVTPRVQETYSIPIYADGKLIRTDVVPKPQD